MRLEPGKLIGTNYSDGKTYRIISIERNCTCSKPLDQLNMEDPPASAPHIHIVACDQQDGGKRYFGWYDEQALKSICGPAPACCRGEGFIPAIIIVEQDRPVQKTMF